MQADTNLFRVVVFEGDGVVRSRKSSVDRHGASIRLIVDSLQFVLRPVGGVVWRLRTGDVIIAIEARTGCV